MIYILKYAYKPTLVFFGDFFILFKIEIKLLFFEGQEFSEKQLFVCLKNNQNFQKKMKILVSNIFQHEDRVELFGMTI